MTKYSAVDAKNRFGEVLDSARRAPVVIEKHGRPVAVVLSQEDFEDLQAAKLVALRHEIDLGLADLEAGRTVDGEEAVRAIRNNR